MGIHVTVDQRLTVRAEGCDPAAVAALHAWADDHFGFENPAYWEARRHRRACRHILRRIELADRAGDDLVLPRGGGRALRKALDRLLPGEPLDATDARAAPPAAELTPRLELRDYQREAVERAAAGRDGVIVAPTGSGKTIIAMGLIARLGVRALILVHTRTLLDQTCEMVERFLGVQPGRIGGGVEDVRDVTVATVQTLIRRDPAHLRDAFGLVLLDEAHHCPASTFTDVIQRFAARWRIGLTATPERADGLHPLLYATLGPELYRVRPGAMVDTGSLCAPRVVPVETSFRGGRMHDRTRMIGRLCEDPRRNVEIVRTVEATRGRHALILSERVQHCEELVRLLGQRRIPTWLLVGHLSGDARQGALEAFLAAPDGVLVATTSLVGEGFDCPDLDTLYLVVPSGNTTRTTQALGRVLRPKPGKAAPAVYDFVDAETPALARSFQSRLVVYRRHRAEIEPAQPAMGFATGAPGPAAPPAGA